MLAKSHNYNTEAIESLCKMFLDELILNGRSDGIVSCCLVELFKASRLLKQCQPSMRAREKQFITILLSLLFLPAEANDFHENGCVDTNSCLPVPYWCYRMLLSGKVKTEQPNSCILFSTQLNDVRKRKRDTATLRNYLTSSREIILLPSLEDVHHKLVRFPSYLGIVSAMYSTTYLVPDAEWDEQQVAIFALLVCLLSSSPSLPDSPFTREVEYLTNTYLSEKRHIADITVSAKLLRDWHFLNPNRIR